MAALGVFAGLVLLTAGYVEVAVPHTLALVGFLAMPGLALFQVYASCFFYAVHRRRAQKAWQGRETVDVFVATCGESLQMIEVAVRAARDMRGPHRTWLLDDAQDPHVEALARRLGVGYRTRAGSEGKKAGGLNAALATTDGELVCIFDVDHRPAPDFLERTAGHFEDPRIGFVQNAITFSNEGACWTARATAETAKDYYFLTNCGKDAVGAATLMGSNAVIRRSALEQIGGYRVGLAEDLETSVALHAAGWRSAYVAEPLAPGLTPEDYVGFAKQQHKWARGVLEAGQNAVRTSMGRLTWAQRLGYLLRFSYYLAPPMAVCGVVSAGASLLLGWTWVEPLLAALMPIFLLFMAARALAFSVFVTGGMPCVTFRGTMLVVASWPVYCRALVEFVLRRPARFVETPKDKMRTPLSMVAPQLSLCAFLLLAVIAGLTWSDPPIVTLLVIGFQLTCHLALVPSLVPGLRRRIRRLLPV